MTHTKTRRAIKTIMKQFEIIDISGDVGIRAFGKSIEDVFKNSAIGMYSLITDLEGVKGEKSISISVASNSLEGLLVSWLNELVFHFDAYNFIGKKIDIQPLTPNPQSPSLKAIISERNLIPKGTRENY